MTNSNMITKGVFTAIALAVAGSGVLVTPADAAGGRKGVYTQDYQFSGPAHGFEGRAAGGYYCSYQRLPNRVCTYVAGKQVCVIKGWTLRQMCQ